MARESGELLLHYRLVEKIGEGGMGTVWRAQDTKLERDAAIKILPDALALDPQFLARFEREARLLASFDHPNLASVFGVHDTDTTRFLAMELVPGEDLSERLQRGPLTVEDAVPILSRIADALEAAHKRGVIHRDLKPANVRLTPDGRVKVLDFGLAKTIEVDESSDSSSDVPLTATGVVLGTAPYMSPEQIRGHHVDARTDIWSFGCVVWECLTGTRPFPGETIPDQVASILNREPAWDSLPDDTPPSLVRLLKRCLAKSRRERLHHFADARIELEEAMLESGALPTTTTTPAPQRIALPVLAIALALSASALVLVLGGRREVPAPREGVLAGARFTKLTDFPGEEIGAAISPDGNYVAFIADCRGPFEVFKGQRGGEFLNVTAQNSEADVHDPKAAIRRLGFLPRDEGLWLSRGGTQYLRTVPLIGSGSKKWLPKGVIHVDWSPDGRQILYSHSTGGDPVYVADATGTDPKLVDLPTEDGHHQHFPTWSPDGRWIYVVRGRMTLGDMNLWRARPDGTGLEQLTTGDQVRSVRFPVPIDKRTVLFVAQDPDGAGPWLWEYDLDTRIPARATIGVGVFTSLSASRDGRRLVATLANPHVSLWTVPILPEEVATEDDVKAFPLPIVRARAPRIRGDRLYYLSSIGGYDGLWCHQAGKSEEIWKGSAAARLEHPGTVSPDGSRIALVVREADRSRLYLIRADGTEPRELMQDVEVAGAACWSPDGEWVAVGGRKADRGALFKARVSDGRTEPVYGIEAINPIWSPDGRTIVFEGAQIGPEMRLLAVTPEGVAIDLPVIRVPVLGSRTRFLPDGSGLVYLRGLDPDYQFCLLDLETMHSRPLTKFASSATMVEFDITPDGTAIVFDRWRNNSDLYLIERADSE